MAVAVTVATDTTRISSKVDIMAVTVARVVQAAMLFRAILSWFFMDDDNLVMSILYAVTEPFIVPIRALFEKMGWFRNLPIDISFFVTYILLSIISMML